jgi:hypothetical protein
LDDFAQHFGQLTSGSKGPEGLEPRKDQKSRAKSIQQDLGLAKFSDF